VLLDPPFAGMTEFVGASFVQFRIAATLLDDPPHDFSPERIAPPCHSGMKRRRRFSLLRPDLCMTLIIPLRTESSRVSIHAYPSYDFSSY
jgi:hypothetical protein